MKLTSNNSDSQGLKDLDENDNLITLYRRSINTYSVGKYREAYEQIYYLASSNFAAAQFDLGWMYYNGRGVEHSIQQAFYWWKRASKSGYHDAKTVLNMLSKMNKSDA
ncbi:MAG: hypothetical protein RLN62_07165 [Rickettsiales bacterium]